jgi:hypothetical protein
MSQKQQIFSDIGEGFSAEFTEFGRPWLLGFVAPKKKEKLDE